MPAQYLSASLTCASTFLSCKQKELIIIAILKLKNVTRILAGYCCATNSKYKSATQEVLNRNSIAGHTKHFLKIIFALCLFLSFLMQFPVRTFLHLLNSCDCN